MRLPVYTAALTGLMASPALAADLELSLEIPRLTVAEYHRPYVAVWYDVKLKNNEGQKWLKDMRQWWRRAGRDMSLPADGVSAATRAPGKHQVVFKPGALPAGQYNLVVEAAREVGGVEVLRAPFQWPPKARATSSAKGSSELGAMSVTVKP